MNETTERGFGDRLDELMQAHPLYSGTRGQSALSRATGVPQPTISRILKKRSAPEMETVIKLARPFGVTCEWLLSERGPQYIADIAAYSADGTVVVAEAKSGTSSANSAETEEHVNTTIPTQGKHVNNEHLKIARQFTDELMNAVNEGRVTGELLDALQKVLWLGVGSSPRGDQHHTKWVNVRGNKKRGTGT